MDDTDLRLEALNIAAGSKLWHSPESLLSEADKYFDWLKRGNYRKESEKSKKSEKTEKPDFAAVDKSFEDALRASKKASKEDNYNTYDVEVTLLDGTAKQRTFKARDYIQLQKRVREVYPFHLWFMIKAKENQYSSMYGPIQSEIKTEGKKK